MAKKTVTVKDQDPESLFRQAAYFEYSSCMLGYHAQVTLIDKRGIMQDRAAECPTIVPGIVLSAFSIELYLKCLLLLTVGEYLQVHTLRDLFNSLNRTTRSDIENSFDKEMSNADSIVRPIVNHDGEPHPEDYYRFDVVINVISNAFAEWRYPDSLPKRITHLVYYGHGPFTKALKEKTLGIRPNYDYWLEKIGKYPPSIQIDDPHS